MTPATSSRILPGNIKLAAADTRTTEAAAAAVVAQRPQRERELGTLEEQLKIDRRVRTTISRVDQPDAITGVLGRRRRPAHQPEPGTTPPGDSPNTKPRSTSPKASALVPAGTGTMPIPRAIGWSKKPWP